MIAQPKPRERSLRRRTPVPRRLLLACALALAVTGTTHADAVIDWNATTGAVASTFGAPQFQNRAYAMVQVSVHDALNSIDPRYESYAVVPTANASASPDAAVAAAAHGTLLGLLTLLPDSQNKTNAITLVNDTYDAALAQIPDGTSKTDGIAAGVAASDAILALRSNDGSATPHLPYTLPPGPGVYQPTPNPEFPDVVTPSFAGWANVLPFALQSATQFPVEPGRLFDLASHAYTRQYNEVMQVGNALVRAASPDSEETDVARFWPGGGANWNASGRIIVEGRGLDMWQHARLFALMNMASNDTGIAAQQYKYTFTFWRPVTAIRWADDGNPHTTSDATWRPLLTTPPYPDYPCALPADSGAHTAVMRRFLGTDNVAFTRTVNAGAVPLPVPLEPLPAKTITREFDSLSDAAFESAEARVFAGIHFRSGCYAGKRLGTEIGRYVFMNYLRPMHGHGRGSN